MTLASIIDRQAILPWCLFLLASSAAFAEPLSHHDNGPLTGYFGIPDSTEGSVLLRDGSFQWSATAMTSSHSLQDARNGEMIILDGETTRLALALRHGVRDDLEIGVEVPFLLHESGGLDPVIDSWHDWFGFPGGFRDTRAHDQLEFRYIDGSETLVDHQTNERGLGDVRLFAGWQIRREADRALALRFGLKLPTGDSDAMLGSGGTDVSLGLAGDHFDAFGISRLATFYRVHAVHLGQPDRLAVRYNDVVGLAALGAEYSINERTSLLVQVAARSSIYDSDVDNLGDSSLAITFGAHFLLTPSYRLSLGVSEDLKVDSAPDVAFQLALHFQPE